MVKYSNNVCHGVWQFSNMSHFLINYFVKGKLGGASRSKLQA